MGIGNAILYFIYLSEERVCLNALSKKFNLDKASEIVTQKE